MDFSPRTFFLLAMMLSAMMTVSPLAQAIPVEAEGRALIANQDLDSARRQALRNASQQALLQAGAYVSSTQSVNQGVLSVDNLRVRSLGNLTDVRVIDERVQGELFILRIRAEVEAQESCQQAQSAGYLKSAAIAAFPIADPLQANLGDLHNAPQVVSRLLTNHLADQGNLKAMNAAHLLASPVTATAASYQQPAGAITNMLQEFRDLDVQFVVSGVIRDLNMYDPSRNSEGNFFRNLYDSLDYRSRRHLRNFAIDLFIHDGFTGALLFSRSYRQGGFWNLDDHERTGFGTAAFLRTDYGQKVNSLLFTMSEDIDRQLKCEPFRTRIINTERNTITFNAGSIAGIRPGDKLTVYRRSTFYDQQNQPHIRLENTQHTLIVNEVHPLFSQGRIGVDSETKNIQQDDVLLAW